MSATSETPGVQARHVLSVLPLVVVVVAPGVASWVGLMAVGHEWLGLHGLWAVLVPLVFDAAALHLARLSQRSVLEGDSALVDRGLVWVYALGSATLNLTHGDQAFGPAGAAFFGVASVSAIVVWDRTLRSYRRDALRERGAIEAALPRFRALRWLVAPGETGRAWRIAVLEGVTSPAEALALSRRTVEQVPAAPLYPAELLTSLPWDSSVAELPAPEGDVDLGAELVEEVPNDDEPIGYELVAEAPAPAARIAPEVLAELTACETKSAALLVAWRELGVSGVPATTDVMPAVAWLAEQGVKVDRSRAYGVRRELATSRRAVETRSERLALVGGER